jgi:hypothetical protein
MNLPTNIEIIVRRGPQGFSKTFDKNQLSIQPDPGQFLEDAVDECLYVLDMFDARTKPLDAAKGLCHQCERPINRDDPSGCPEGPPAANYVWQMRMCMACGRLRWYDDWPANRPDKHPSHIPHANCPTCGGDPITPDNRHIPKQPGGCVSYVCPTCHCQRWSLKP